jgi:hypothetical protein
MHAAPLAKLMVCYGILTPIICDICFACEETKILRPSIDEPKAQFRTV